MLHPMELSPPLVAQIHFTLVLLFVCSTYHFSQGRDDFPQSGQGLVDVCSFLVRRGKAHMLKPPLQSHVKAPEKMRNIQYGVGKEQLVLLGNHHPPAGTHSETGTRQLSNTILSRILAVQWARKQARKGNVLVGDEGGGHGVPTSRRGPQVSSHL